MSVVYLVHCIDTEGPLDEYGPKRLLGGWSYEAEPFDAAAYAKDPAAVIGEHRKRTLGSWDLIAAMLRHITSREFRHRMPDGFGGGWVYNWFCMDHLGFVDNPRARDMGMHRVFDFYRELDSGQRAGDGIHWHFHSASTYSEGHKPATSYLNSPFLREIIARRLLDRRWFPVANRAGFHDERPDSHWFLEQWIPFDLSNKANVEIDMAKNPDLAEFRYGDWRGAPDDWSTYHPSHDHHQLPGNCRRKMARCLNLLNRFGNLTEAELVKGFERAARGQPTLVAYCSHDWRDMAPEVDYVRTLLARVAPRYPQVCFKFAEAVEAFNAVHPPAPSPPLALDCEVEVGPEGCRLLTISTRAGKVFGPQPFLAVRTRSHRVIHDNLGFGADKKQWRYVFDDQSILPDDVRQIAVGANDAAGHQSIHVLDVAPSAARTVVRF